ncbi:hypothetical protein OR221_2991, partial [Microbacterium laevaniformans OR221]
IPHFALNLVLMVQSSWEYGFALIFNNGTHLALELSNVPV